ncbi:YopX family protein [Helcococcus kunzii]|uniref:YopX family protein n=1 Tax=Helcococcus kunzii TaxID=40091 RepID=UPI0038A4DB04
MIPKFRAWDKKHKEICEVWQIHFDLKFVHCFNKWARNLKFEDCILMQSTGLFDKNGVEIFEGDILKIQTFDFYSKKINDEYIGQVCFSRGGFFVLTDGHHTDFCLCGKSTATMEVIGKLYENPELLEVGK